jgi:hypothetical protein
VNLAVPRRLAWTRGKGGEEGGGAAAWAGGLGGCHAVERRGAWPRAAGGTTAGGRGQAVRACPG